MSLEIALARISAQSKSGLENQRQVILISFNAQIACVLAAVQETLQGETSPIAYFGALMSLIKELTEPVVYLLAIVMPL